MSHTSQISPAHSQRPYRYRNTRPVSVFALAVLAAVGAWGTVAGAAEAIDGAMHSRAISPPPDLKKVIDRIERDGRTVAGRVIAAR